MSKKSKSEKMCLDDRLVILKVENMPVTDGRRLGICYIQCPVCDISDCVSSLLASGCTVIIDSNLNSSFRLLWR